MPKLSKKKKCFILGFFCIVVMLLIFPLRCTNVSLVFLIENAEESSEYNLKINGKEAITIDCCQSCFAGWRLDPEIEKIESITLINAQGEVSKISEIRICAGKYQPTDRVIYSIKNPSYEKQDNSISFSDTVIKTIKKETADNWLVKKCLFELLTVVFLLGILSDRNMNKWKKLLFWLLFLFEAGRWCDRFFDQIIQKTGNHEWGHIAKIISLCIMAVILVIMTYQAFRISSKTITAGIYVLSVVYICFQSLFYMVNIANTPDEDSHISYVAYLEKENKVIPQFDEMKIIENMNEEKTVFGEETNQLCHPPLYYQIMRLCRGVEVQGDVLVIHYLRLRIFSFLIALGGLGIFLYLGFSRISKEKPELHLLYNAIIIGVPMSIFNITGVTNDTLALVGCAVWFWGAIRFIENKTGYGTYLMVIGGVCIALFSKLTAGLMLGVATVIFVCCLMLHEKSAERILCRQVLTVIPFAILILLYFGAVYLQCGTVQPSYSLIDYAGFINSEFYVKLADRKIMSVWEYIKYYIESFFQTWTAVPTHAGGALYKSGPWYSLSRILTLSIWFLPLMAGVLEKGKKKLLFFSTYLALIFTVVLQFYHAYYEFFFVSGYTGAYSSRYYLCLLGGVAFMIVSSLEKISSNLEEKSMVCIKQDSGLKTETVKFLFRYACLVASLILLYSGFIYYLLYKSM